MALVLRSFIRTFRCRVLAAPTWALGVSLPSRQPHIYQHIPSQFYKFRSTATSAPTTLADPARPSLYYHLLPSPNPLSSSVPAYAVSFLEHPPEDANSPAILGWLPAAVSAPGDDSEAGLGDFHENPHFTELLYKVLQKAIEDGSDELLNAEAAQRGEGWIHINDDRNVPTQGRISDPQDIIASVMVEDGRMLPKTYSAMPAYRLCTTDGLTTLPGSLQEKLLEELRIREGTR